MQTLQERLRLVQQGHDVMALNKRPLNKFLHPDAAEAEFPQQRPGSPPLDFRSEALPLAGLVGRGQRKKFTDEEKLEMVSVFNCLPGKTEGPIVQKTREALRRKEISGEMDMINTNDIIISNTATTAGGEEGQEEDMIADNGTAEDVLADIRRQKIPVVKDFLKQRATQRPKGRFRPKGT